MSKLKAIGAKLGGAGVNLNTFISSLAVALIVFALGEARTGLRSIATLEDWRIEHTKISERAINELEQLKKESPKAADLAGVRYQLGTIRADVTGLSNRVERLEKKTGL